jgi:hypothetical protein
VHRQANLLEIVRTLRFPSRLASLLNGRQHDGHQQANHGRDDQDFDERKTV